MQQFGKDANRRIVTAAQPVQQAVEGFRHSEGDWHPQLLITIAGELLTNAKELLQGDQEQNACRCAWAARNILELYFWIRYVAGSRENARRFHEDMVCDFDDMLKRCSRSPELAIDVTSGRVAWETAMQVVEVIDNDDRYLSVAQVAKDFGEEAGYNIVNKFLSKLVHPTSLAIQLRATPVFTMLIPMITELALSPLETACPILAKALNDCQAGSQE